MPGLLQHVRDAPVCGARRTCSCSGLLQLRSRTPSLGVAETLPLRPQRCCVQLYAGGQFVLLTARARCLHRLLDLSAHPLSVFCPRSTTVFSHAQTVVICSGCSTVLCQPTGGKARLTEGCSFRKKSE